MEEVGSEGRVDSGYVDVRDPSYTLDFSGPDEVDGLGLPDDGAEELNLAASEGECTSFLDLSSVVGSRNR